MGLVFPGKREALSKSSSFLSLGSTLRLVPGRSTWLILWLATHPLEERASMGPLSATGGSHEQEALPWWAPGVARRSVKRS
jgi:hypothetical protein